MWSFLREADRPARRALIAASLGWMLDAFDVSLYALVLPSLMTGLSMDAATSGAVQSAMLIAAAVGGVAFGLLADRFGRRPALMLSVLLYSVFTAACGFVESALQLVVFRVLLGLGMGGEWASGAALVSETWPSRHRGKALGLVQSSWAIGVALAAAVNWLVQDVAGLDWRAVFFVGILPALFALWVRRGVDESAAWQRARRAPVSLAQAAGGRMLPVTIALTLMNACTLFAYWGLNTWTPSYLRAPFDEGGVGLSNAAMSGLVVVTNIGTWCGYVTFGMISDAVGRKRTYIAYLVTAAALVVLFASIRDARMLLVVGPVMSFFATGHFSGFGAVTADLYPASVRATLQGFTYNAGRVVSAAAPALAGSVAADHGYQIALSITAVALALAAALWAFIPETRDRT
jgi:MFS family permease